MVRRVRLWSGLVLMAFVVTHYLNHALGLVGLEALEAGRQAFLWLWRGRPGTLILYGALIVHMALAFWGIYQRRKLSMPPWEAVQLLVGLAIPPSWCCTSWATASPPNCSPRMTATFSYC